jgi:hypothetical protein
MQELSTDIFLYKVCTLLDGLNLAQLSAVCKRFRDLIKRDKRCQLAINCRLIWLNHPMEFKEVTRAHAYVSHGSVLRYEGTRRFLSKCGTVGEFNDFYPVCTDRIVREIDRLKKIPNVKNVLLIMYKPLDGYMRFELGEFLGTIHRGTSIVVYFNTCVLE